MNELIVNSYDEMLSIAQDFSRRLNGGEIIGLSGELGTGKTAFVKGVAAGLGFQGYVKSPTFTIVNQYKTDRLTIFHFDIYRLSTYEELLLLGFESYTGRDSVILIEWFDRFDELKELADTKIYLEYLGENSRKLKIIYKE